MGLESPAMQAVLQRFAHAFPEADTMRFSFWQKDLLSAACYNCACMKPHVTLLKE